MGLNPRPVPIGCDWVITICFTSTALFCPYTLTYTSKVITSQVFEANRNRKSPQWPRTPADELKENEAGVDSDLCVR